MGRIVTGEWCVEMKTLILIACVWLACGDAAKNVSFRFKLRQLICFL